MNFYLFTKSFHKLLLHLSIFIGFLCTCIVTVTLLFVCLPKISASVSQFDLAAHQDTFDQIYLVFTYSVCIIFGTFLLSLFALILRRIYLWFKSIGISRREHKIQALNEAMNRLKKESALYTKNSQEIKVAVQDLKSTTTQIENQFKTMRSRLRQGFKSLERDLNFLLGFILRQLKDNTIEMLTLIQSFFSLYIPEILGTSSAGKILAPIISVLIFFTCVSIKNPYSSKLVKIVFLALLYASLFSALFHKDITLSPSELAQNLGAVGICYMIALVGLLCWYIYRVITNAEESPEFFNLKLLTKV